MVHREKRLRLNHDLERPCGRLLTHIESHLKPDRATSDTPCTDKVGPVTELEPNPKTMTLPPPPSSSMDGPVDKLTWQGWAEIENDPTVFNIMLREWGIRGVCVNEVVPLDAIYDSSPSSTLGLIFLSRYQPGQKKKDNDEEGEEKKGQKLTVETRDLWFANQISTYSCATVALMNIIGNVPAEKIGLGPEISQFLASTKVMSSKDKGLALDSFGHVRRVHNSFATLIDMRSVDLRLRQDAKSYNRRRHRKKKQQQQRKFTPKPKSKLKSRTSKQISQCTSKASGKDVENTDDDDDDDDEQGYHFTAYIPSHDQTHLWRMDGLERNPEPLHHHHDGPQGSHSDEHNNKNDTTTNSGAGSNNNSSSTSTNWLTMAIAELSNQISRRSNRTNNRCINDRDEHEGDTTTDGSTKAEIEFSVLSLVATTTSTVTPEAEAGTEAEEVVADLTCGNHGVKGATSTSTSASASASASESDRIREDWGPALAEVVRLSTMY